MSKYKYQDIQQIVQAAQTVLIIQADNPDADSLASALALESILHEMAKEPVMYCGIDMPNYLKYLSGWDRVSSEIPNNVDATIIVDTSSLSLLENLENIQYKAQISSKPVIVLDHHNESANDISYANIVINDSSKVSTGELIYSLAKDLDWPLPLTALENIMTSILADSLGLTTSNTTADTYIVMSELVKAGVNRPKLEENRRAFGKMAEKIFRYKGSLIDRTEIIDDKIAILIIPQAEINEYSPLYNPAPLIQPEHLQTEGIKISIVLKHYDSGRITGAIRSNLDAPISSDLAGYFGGGGHKYASGFKLMGKQINDIKTDVIEKTQEFLAKL